MMLNNEVLTVAAFCDKYHINPATYYRNVKQGKAPPSIKIGGSTRILAEDERAWLEDQRAVALRQERTT